MSFLLAVSSHPEEWAVCREVALLLAVVAGHHGACNGLVTSSSAPSACLYLLAVLNDELEKTYLKVGWNGSLQLHPHMSVAVF